MHQHAWRITVIWVAITEAGQRALADKRLVG
jgi:hypothetical protein